MNRLNAGLSRKPLGLADEVEELAAAGIVGGGSGELKDVGEGSGAFVGGVAEQKAEFGDGGGETKVRRGVRTIQAAIVTRNGRPRGRSSPGTL